MRSPFISHGDPIPRAMHRSSPHGGVVNIVIGLVAHYHAQITCAYYWNKGLSSTPPFSPIRAVLVRVIARALPISAIHLPEVSFTTFYNPKRSERIRCGDSVLFGRFIALIVSLYINKSVSRVGSYGFMLEV